MANSKKLPPKIFPSAREDATKSLSGSAQYTSSAYRLAFTDTDFLLREELRPVRFQLELLKPDLIQQEHGIDSTVVIFGSARHLSRDEAQAQLDEAHAQLAASPRSSRAKAAVKRAETVLGNSKFYEQARRLGALVTENSARIEGCRLVVVTGGGPGIMEAANRGAHESGGQSIGLNIVLPAEQEPNPYITPELCFRFHYFALRKMHFLMRARALVAFPGGYGTLDELFETLALIQTGKSQRVPVLLFCEEFWRGLVNFDVLVESGNIGEEDIELFRYVETAEQAWQEIASFYSFGCAPSD
ncbi:MAG: TIGR00730 family Rossman fold protein [Gammaproteobacteria bacterium]|jgi:uncharacterized protein (TIGR00730 family)|nr:TIGR00730 family Rossman fold protein [Gammaproteobacteria bacterium]MBP6053172.1 TIGR00730 family Rossman fold protein [Pseudomonadales bacterium]MBK6582679.1 TIGR00730 family Rossman fold protein [Gammaproteobacteria bacterium]MBK7167951.1 TIGR00730 family Rossman fold protein [Gammaproteobacteria bacterium]MBK7518809.1 TIGR00730 family Rossman fold protein [Gammaproteobacteria bacterium]